MAKRLDRRTRRSRDVRSTVAILRGLVSKESCLTGFEFLVVERAAELLVIAKEAREGALKHLPDDLTNIVRIERAAQKALEALSQVISASGGADIRERLLSLHRSAGPLETAPADVVTCCATTPTVSQSDDGATS